MEVKSQQFYFSPSSPLYLTSFWLYREWSFNWSNNIDYSLFWLNCKSFWVWNGIMRRFIYKGTKDLGWPPLRWWQSWIWANSIYGPFVYCATYTERKEVKDLNGSSANKCIVGFGGEAKVALEGDLHRICFVFCIVDDLKRNWFWRGSYNLYYFLEDIPSSFPDNF